jgi:hypothetical protein
MYSSLIQRDNDTDATTTWSSGDLLAHPPTRHGKSIFTGVPKTAFEGFWVRRNLIGSRRTLHKPFSARRDPTRCPAPRGHFRSTGEASSVPDRARSEAGSDGPDVSLAH